MPVKDLVVDARMLHASGIGTYIDNLLPLISEKSHDLTFDIICRPQDTSKISQNTIPNNSAIYSISEQFTLLNRQSMKAGLFWSPHYNIPVFLPAKLLVTIHDVFHLAMPDFIEGMHKRLYARMMFSAVKHKASHVICVSEFTKSELIRLTDINPDKVTVIYNGVAKEWFSIKRTDRPYHKPYLLFVGNIKPHKNLSSLLQAFTLLKDEIPHDLVIVGNNKGFITEDRNVMQYAQTLGNRVFFTGYVDDALLKQYFAHADCFVFPSLYEGFGLPPLEAMACGCPTLVSNIASLPEVCGDAALYCDPYDTEDIRAKIMLLLGSPSLRNALVTKGRERVKSFSWDVAAVKTLDIINQFIE